MQSARAVGHEVRKFVGAPQDVILVEHALALANSARFGETIDAYGRVIDLNAEHTYAYLNKGVALANIGRHHDAIDA